MSSFLIIQTAFIGDVILATPLVENLRKSHPKARIDFLLRKGNEGLLKDHPHIDNLFIWDKKKGKYKTLFKLIRQLRKHKYDYVINVQRFATSGFITLFTSGQRKIGFDKNPLSIFYYKKITHEIKAGIHEVDRNLKLIEKFSNIHERSPKLYPAEADFEKIKAYTEKQYICMAPASVWFTKQLPREKWIELINGLDNNFNIYFLGAPSDNDLVEQIISESQHTNTMNLCGELNLLQSAALMKGAAMNYVNDSAPLHLATSMQAPVTAFFCSTIANFGFGPVNSNGRIGEVAKNMECRPCGLHGKKDCPQKHFKCGYDIDVAKYKLQL